MSTYKHLHHHTAGAKCLNALREQPLTGDEINLPDGGRARNMICKIDVMAGRRGTIKKRPGSPTSIYYLYGDERRAVRKFIRDNEEFVASCLEDGSNPLESQWDDIMYQLLLEEYDMETANERQ